MSPTPRSKQLPNVDDNANTEPKTILVTRQAGVWEIVYAKAAVLRDTRLPSPAIVKEAISALPYLWLFFVDFYNFSPFHFSLHMLSTAWQSLYSSLALYFTTGLLHAVGERLNGRDPDGSLLVKALLARVLFSFWSNLSIKLRRRSRVILYERAKRHFAIKALHAVLSLDLATAEDAEAVTKLGSMRSFDHPSSWTAFEGILSTARQTVGMFSSLVTAYMLVKRHSTDMTFIAICMTQPLLALIPLAGLNYNAYVSYSISSAYNRLLSLYRLSFDEKYRWDRLSDGANTYIEDEFGRLVEELGDTRTEPAAWQLAEKEPFLLHVFTALSADIPLLYFAFKAIIGPTDLDLASLAILQQTAQAIRNSIEWFFRYTRRLGPHLNTVRNIYTAKDLPKKLQDGDVSYPPQDDASERGMGIELRDVSFVYPSTTKKALDKVSFAIAPGQLVVIVGVNGSGKSSLVKLLSRLYDPTEGTILVDGHPLPSYRLADVRAATAILRQDHTPYPLSLRENVALGRPTARVSDAEVQAAMAEGGADAFIKRLPDGADTVLDPVKTWITHFPGERVKALADILTDKEKSTAISGGESQRLAASRTFLRLTSGSIRLLVADEPTSALDPEGEFELFSRLRARRAGKTLIFVTHRFGHLTKHADLILCMKEGQLVEQGTHEELIAKGGEFARLHRVQAQAFVDES